MIYRYEVIQQSANRKPAISIEKDSLVIPDAGISTVASSPPVAFISRVAAQITPNTMRKLKAHDNKLMYHAGPVREGKSKGCADVTDSYRRM